MKTSLKGFNERNSFYAVVYWKTVHNATRGSSTTRVSWDMGRRWTTRTKGAPVPQRTVWSPGVVTSSCQDLSSVESADAVTAWTPAAQTSRPGRSWGGPSERSWSARSAEATVTPAWPPGPAGPAGAERPGGERPTAAGRGRSRFLHGPASLSTRTVWHWATASTVVRSDSQTMPTAPGTQWTAWWRCEESAAATGPSGWTHSLPEGGDLIYWGTAAPSSPSTVWICAAIPWTVTLLQPWPSHARTRSWSPWMTVGMICREWSRNMGVREVGRAAPTPWTPPSQSRKHIILFIAFDFYNFLSQLFQWEEAQTSKETIK